MFYRSTCNCVSAVCTVARARQVVTNMIFPAAQVLRTFSRIDGDSSAIAPFPGCHHISAQRSRQDNPSDDPSNFAEVTLQAPDGVCGTRSTLEAENGRYAARGQAEPTVWGRKKGLQDHGNKRESRVRGLRRSWAGSSRKSRIRTLTA